MNEIHHYLCTNKLNSKIHVIENANENNLKALKDKQESTEPFLLEIVEENKELHHKTG